MRCGARGDKRLASNGTGHWGLGILAAHQIATLLAQGGNRSQHALAADQIQPASLDLRLGRRAWRMRASFLPGRNRSIRACLDWLSLHEIDLEPEAVLETGCVYVAELLEDLAPPKLVAAAANPKSSTGRIDVFTRIISDGCREFDVIEPGYSGPLFAEICPRTFPILVRTGSRLSQIRFRHGSNRLDDAELYARETLVTSTEPSIAGGVGVSVDLACFDRAGLVGYRAKRHMGLIDIDAAAAHEILDFGNRFIITGFVTSSSIRVSFIFSRRRNQFGCHPIMPPR
jgi:dCTP deaminase